MVEDNPLDIKNIKEKQDEDKELQQSATRYPEWYSRKTFNDITNVLCYILSQVMTQLIGK